MIDGPSMTQSQRIVVIEDEADILEVLQYNLTREGYRVAASRDGEEGLQRIRDENPDLVLLDLMLPGLDGIEVCRRLKADPVTAGVPVIMVTAKGEESDVILGLQMLAGLPSFAIAVFEWTVVIGGGALPIQTLHLDLHSTLLGYRHAIRSHESSKPLRHS